MLTGISFLVPRLCFLTLKGDSSYCSSDFHFFSLSRFPFLSWVSWLFCPSQEAPSPGHRFYLSVPSTFPLTASVSLFLFFHFACLSDVSIEFSASPCSDIYVKIWGSELDFAVATYLIILISKKKKNVPWAFPSIQTYVLFFTTVRCFSLVPLISLYHLANSYFKLYFFWTWFCLSRWDLVTYLDGFTVCFVTNAVVVVVLCCCSSALPSVHLGHIPHVNLSTVFLQLCQNTVQLPNSKCIFLGR